MQQYVQSGLLVLVVLAFFCGLYLVLGHFRPCKRCKSRLTIRQGWEFVNDYPGPQALKMRQMQECLHCGHLEVVGEMDAEDLGITDPPVR